jgi:hydroxylamine reductase
LWGDIVDEVTRRVCLEYRRDTRPDINGRSRSLGMSLMHCDQCEQTQDGNACTEVGVCGKDPDVESLQKLLLYGVKGLSAYKHHARRLGQTSVKVDEFVEEALFATMTNVNFDLESLLELVLECGHMNYLTLEMLDRGHC